MVAGVAVITSPTISSKPIGMRVSIPPGHSWARASPGFFAPEQTARRMTKLFFDLRYRKARRAIPGDVWISKENGNEDHQDQR
jgi:hypothetical protein